MSDFRVCFSFLNMLESFDFDVKEFTFNGFTLAEFKNYRTIITEQQKQFDKTLNEIIISDKYSTDIVIRNLGLLNLKFDEVYTSVTLGYNSYVNSNKYLNPPVSKVNDSRKILRGSFVQNKELSLLDSILIFHVNSLKKAKEQIYKMFSFVSVAANSLEPSVSVATKIDTKVNPSVVDVNSVSVCNTSSSKLLCNLKKREIALLFILLVEKDIIKVSNTQELYSFIEDNFTYVDNSRNEQKISNIVKINTEFSRLTNGKNKASNEKFKKQIIEKYKDLFYDFFEDFDKYNLSKFREKFELPYDC